MKHAIQKGGITVVEMLTFDKERNMINKVYVTNRKYLHMQTAGKELCF